MNEHIIKKSKKKKKHKHKQNEEHIDRGTDRGTIFDREIHSYFKNNIFISEKKIFFETIFILFINHRETFGINKLYLCALRLNMQDSNYNIFPSRYFVSFS